MKLNIKLKNNYDKLNPDGFYPQQIEALKFLNEFMNSDEREATLSGYAGTGKTYILKYFVDKLCTTSVCPTAPTHKAVRQIEKSLNRKGKTLQSLHGLRPNTDISNFDISNPKFDPKGNTYIQNYGLVIIDECSMISDDIYELNLQRAKEFNVKILYVGDKLQLEPVRRKKGRVGPSKSFDTKFFFQLTDVVRQTEGNSLLKLFPLIRADIENKTNTFFDYIKYNRNDIINGKGYKVLNTLDFKYEIVSNFKTNVDVDEHRILAYTNISVKQNNKYVRNNILEDSNDIINEDDIITSYGTIVDEFYENIITNSEDYVIDNIRPYVNSYGIKTYAVSFKNLYTNMITNTLQIADHKDKSFVKYHDLLDKLHNKATGSDPRNRRRNWSAYYEFKNNILTLVNFSLKTSGAVVKKDLDYGYAITIHKSQGSTYKNIYFDLYDTMYSKNKYGRVSLRPDRNRLVYVALTRATHKVVMKL